MHALHVVLASDGSEGALRAAGWLKANFSPSDVRVTVVTVHHAPIDVGSPTFAPEPAYAEQMEDAAINEARRAVSRTEEALADFRPDCHVIGGMPMAEILIQFATDHRADVIVTGRRARGGLGLGSISRALAHNAPVPIWVIP
jgi:nucleotide-binding universal stress UspA family protein